MSATLWAVAYQAPLSMRFSRQDNSYQIWKLFGFCLLRDFFSPLPSWTLIAHLLKLEAIPEPLNLCLSLIFFLCVLQLNSLYCNALTFQIYSYVVSSLVLGEENGNPLQCSCLENPRDRGAWWAAIYGVAQSRTRLKWLSSSRSKQPASSRVELRLPLLETNV